MKRESETLSQALYELSAAAYAASGQAASGQAGSGQAGSGQAGKEAGDSEGPTVDAQAEEKH
jgi:hypothetical protein